MSSLEMFSLVAGLVGGLAMFLYGMNVMSGGLTKAAGGKLESVLAKVTEHPFIAYLFGVGVTALVQSSSASTVMVVGLVNSGIMTLKQAVNVVPRLAPRITPTACLRLMIPELTRPTTMTVEADDD